MLCQGRGVLSRDVFYTNGRGSNTFRLGFSRLADDDIVRGIQIIGDTLKTDMRS